MSVGEESRRAVGGYRGDESLLRIPHGEKSK